MESEFKICIDDGSEPLPEFVVDQNAKAMQLYDWQRRGLKYFFENKCCAVFQCATGCLSGDTYIEVPRNLDKYPYGRKIKDLVGKKDFFVYTFNIEKKVFELKKAKSVWYVGKEEVFEILLQSGKKIKATANHPFLVNIKKESQEKLHRLKLSNVLDYRNVEELNVGDYVKTFNRPTIRDEKNGELIRVESKKRRVLEHRFIFEQIYGSIDKHGVVHHIDGNRFNNSVENLECLSCYEHNRRHTKERGFFGKALWKNGVHPKGMLGKHHINKGSKQDYRDEEFLKNGFESYKYKTNKIESCKKCSETLNNKGKDFLTNRAKYGGYTRYFEKIIDIKYIGKEKVYDMEVEDNHNFIANGIVVHNCGKTRFGIEVIKQVLEKDPDVKVLIVVPKNVILENGWYPELYNAGISIRDIGVYYGAIKEYAKITITNMQNIENVDFEAFKFVLYDEIHNFASTRLLPYLEKDIKYKLGLSATLERIDKKHYKILDAFNYNLFEYGAKEALQDGILNPFNFYNVSVEMDLETEEEYLELTQNVNATMQAGGGYSKIMRSSSPLKFKMLALLNKRKMLVNNYPRKMDVVKAICEKFKDDKFIIFQEYNKQTSKSYWQLLESGVKACVVHSGISNAIREQNLIDFKNGKYNVLLASKVLDEGWNVPSVDTAIIVAGNSTSRQTIQRMGRVLRKKTKASKLFQIYCKNTVEEDYSEKRAELFKELCSAYNFFDYGVDEDEFIWDLE